MFLKHIATYIWKPIFHSNTAHCCFPSFFRCFLCIYLLDDSSCQDCRTQNIITMLNLAFDLYEDIAKRDILSNWSLKLIETAFHVFMSLLLCYIHYEIKCIIYRFRSSIILYIKEHSLSWKFTIYLWYFVYNWYLKLGYLSKLRFIYQKNSMSRAFSPQKTNLEKKMCRILHHMFLVKVD